MNHEDVFNYEGHEGHRVVEGMLSVVFVVSFVVEFQ